MVLIMHLLTTLRTEPMLRVSTEKKRGKTVLSVEGRLAGQWVTALAECWRELHAASPREKVSVNLCGVSFIDAAGKVLLKEIHRQGGRLVAEGCLNQANVREIVGSEDEPRQGSRRKRDAGPHIFFYGFLLATLLLPAALRAQQPAGTAPSAGAADAVRLTLDQAVALP